MMDALPACGTLIASQTHSLVTALRILTYLTIFPAILWSGGLDALRWSLVREAAGLPSKFTGTDRLYSSLYCTTAQVRLLKALYLQGASRPS